MIVTREYTKEHKIKPILSILKSEGKEYEDCIYDIIGKDDVDINDPGYIGEYFDIRDGNFTILPTPYNPKENIGCRDDPEGKRDVYYLTGGSGCGKTYQSARYSQNYRKMYPNNNIILISHQPPTEKTDPMSLQNLDCIFFDLRNPKVCENNFVGPNKLKLQELADSLVIFDDYENIRDKAVYKGVFNLILDILFTGRHYRCSTMLIRHTRTSVSETTQILTETPWICMFPGGITAESIEYFSNRYCGISKPKMREILHYCHKNNERYMYCHCNYPIMVVTDHSIRIIT